MTSGAFEPSNPFLELVTNLQEAKKRTVDVVGHDEVWKSIEDECGSSFGPNGNVRAREVTGAIGVTNMVALLEQAVKELARNRLRQKVESIIDSTWLKLFGYSGRSGEHGDCYGELHGAIGDPEFKKAMADYLQLWINSVFQDRGVFDEIMREASIDNFGCMPPNRDGEWVEEEEDNWDDD
jgi:hypothetical protein